jgi:hypothetical protein
MGNAERKESRRGRISPEGTQIDVMRKEVLVPMF